MIRTYWGCVLSIENEGDLGFAYRVAKKGSVLVSHHRKIVTILRGPKAIEFIEKVKVSSFFEQQQLMARATGNYKRGNERISKNHARNRRR